MTVYALHDVRTNKGKCRPYTYTTIQHIQIHFHAKRNSLRKVVCSLSPFVMICTVWRNIGPKTDDVKRKRLSSARVEKKHKCDAYTGYLLLLLMDRNIVMIKYLSPPLCRYYFPHQHTTLGQSSAYSLQTAVPVPSSSSSLTCHYSQSCTSTTHPTPVDSPTAHSHPPRP